MTQAQFLNTLKILLSINPHLVPGMATGHKIRFERDPARFYIKADDTTADRLWAMIEARQPGGSASASANAAKETKNED